MVSSGSRDAAIKESDQYNRIECSSCLRFQSLWKSKAQELNPQNAAVINSFYEITSASKQEALFFLESHNWDLDAAVSTFLDNNNAAAPIVPHLVPASHSLSPSPSHSPEYSPSRRPRALSHPAYQLRSKRATSGTSKEDNKPPTARTRGIRTLSVLNRRLARDVSDSDSDEPNEYYTGGEKKYYFWEGACLILQN